MAVKGNSGFQLNGHLNGNVNPPSHMYQKSTTAGQDSVVYLGDPIAITSAGTVHRLHGNYSADSTRSDWFLGVCTGIFESQQGRPLTNRARHYSATADASWIDVCDDPDAIWEVSFGATANQTIIGSMAYVIYSSANSAAGISGAGLHSDSANTPHAQSSGVNHAFRIIGIVNNNLDGFTNDQDGRVRIVSVTHANRSATAL